MFEPTPQDKAEIVKLLTFESAPQGREMTDRARRIVQIVAESGAEAAMIGGAPFFMGRLESALEYAGVHALYAFSRRESVDEVQPDGSVKKVAVFKHVGFVAA